MSTIQNFVRARANLSVLRAGHFHVSARASVCVKTTFLDWPSRASGYPPVEFVGLSTSPQGVHNMSELFLAGLV